MLDAKLQSHQFHLLKGTSMKHFANQVTIDAMQPMDKNGLKEIHNLEELFSSGYLSYLPYRAQNKQELVIFATNHTCPCCKTALLSQNAINNISALSTCPTNLYSFNQQCCCGFDVPFHIIASNSPSFSIKKTSEKQIGAKEKTKNSSINNNINSLETINLHCRYLLHLALYDEAIVTIERLTNHYPSHALLPFYHAFALDKKGRQGQALNYYDNCLDLDPECKEAWHNKALILHHLKHTEEANFHLMRYCRLSSKSQEVELRKNLLASKLLNNTDGLFGKLRVMQNSTVRQLTINNEIEGSFWLKNNKPSNIPAGDYVAGFLLAGCYTMADQYAVKGLMLGLGAGAGVVSLLENFNKLQLTVIEIDPNMIGLAIEYFPLLKHFLQTGRLTIICQDAINYVASMATQFDFTLIDLYQGDLSYPSPFREKNFLSKIASSSHLVGINLIQPQNWQQFQQVIDEFSHAGISLKSCFPTGVRGSGELPFQNRVLFSEVVDNAINFIPYLRVEANYLHQSFRRDFMHMLLRCENLAENKKIATSLNH